MPTITAISKNLVHGKTKNLLFVLLLIVLLHNQCAIDNRTGIIMTVKGPVSADRMGICLSHEHILVDFIGADSISDSRYARAEVINKALPYLKMARNMGCETFFECTPAYLGRDPLLLKSLSDSTGLNIITNTGYYGAYNNKYIPASALNESADQLAQRWINEWENGIDDSGIKPGFIKISVDGHSLSEFHRRLITAAARTHLKTGLTIASHTGPFIPAFEQIEILEKESVSPDAFIWVHANVENELSKIVGAAKKGVWISFDNLSDESVNEMVNKLIAMKNNNLLHKVLVSHDAGWYDPAKVNGGEYKGYTVLFEKLLPALRRENFTESEIKQILIINPARAFEIRVRKKI